MCSMQVPSCQPDSTVEPDYSAYCGPEGGFPAASMLMPSIFPTEAEQLPSVKAEPAAGGSKRQSKVKRTPSAASLAQKKYMDRQKVWHLHKVFFQASKVWCL